MIEQYAGIKFPHLGKGGKWEQLMYPIYIDNLRLHLKGVKPWISHRAKIRALDLNFVTFLKCHPSLLTTSARSVVFFHMRKEQKSGHPNSQSIFSSALRSINVTKKWRKLSYIWLFLNVFLYATNHGCQYQDNAADCHRCIRDWETNGREYFTVSS